MKKVLIVTPELKLAGGVSSYWNAIIPELKKEKNSVIDNFEVGGNGLNLFGPIRDQLNFRRHIKRDYDAVLLNPSLGVKSFFRDSFFAKRLKKKEIPFIVFFRGWDLDFEKKVTERYRKYFLRTFGNAKRIIVLSEDFKKKIRQWGYKGSITVESTTINSKLITDFKIEDKLNNLENLETVKILFLSRILREKGLFETVEAFRSLCKDYSNLELYIAGDGKDFDSLVSKVSMDDNIFVLGHIEGDTKSKLFKDCHIYCLPSYSEGLPNSLLEAMAFGLTVITTRVGGLNDFFQPENMGYFVKVRDENQISEKLKFLIDNPKKMIPIANFNFNYANKNLLSNIVAKRILKLIKAAMND